MKHTIPLYNDPLHYELRVYDGAGAIFLRSEFRHPAMRDIEARHWRDKLPHGTVQTADPVEPAPHHIGLEFEPDTLGA